MKEQPEKQIKADNHSQYNLLIDAITDLMYSDAHHWSERPCATCKAITVIIKKPFGCYRYADERKK